MLFLYRSKILNVDLKITQIRANVLELINETMYLTFREFAQVDYVKIRVSRSGLFRPSAAIA